MSNNIDILNHKSLSIQLCSDGFSFCIYCKENQVYEQLINIDFDSSLTQPTALYEEVNKIFKENDVLHQSFQEVILIHHNNINTFVPTPYFDETLLIKYLENNIKVFANDFITHDSIITLGIKNVYVPFVNVNNFIFDTFGSFTFLHSSTVFVKNILNHFNVSEIEMFINVYKNDFQLLVLEYNQLLLFNSFEFNTPEDFVYYILFVSEQLKMDNNQFKLTLFGDIKQEDECYKLLYRYVRNVVFYNDLNTNASTAIKVENHQHYNLLHLHS